MSKNQYKTGKIIGILQKMRLSLVIKKLDVYKPCLLILYINGTDLAVIGNRDFRVFGLSSEYSSSMHIKSLLAMYLNVISSIVNTLPSIFTIGRFKILK